VDAVPVEIATGAVVVLGGAWVCVSSQDLGIAKWDAGDGDLGGVEVETLPQAGEDVVSIAGTDESPKNGREISLGSEFALVDGVQMAL